MTEFQLRTLGGLSLLRDGQVLQRASGQRKRLMLLALVATYHEGRGISRDRVLGLLWPESDEARARNALNQALFGLRRELAADPIVGGPDLRLDPEVVQCDLAMLWNARAARDDAGVVEAYTGPFLDGVFISGAPELTALIEEARASADRAFREALTRLARKADAAHDPAAVGLWRRLAVAAPLDAALARSLMYALAASGDRTGAIAHARVYAAVVSSELGVDADPSVAALAREIAREPEPRVQVPHEPAVVPDASVRTSISAELPSASPASNVFPGSRRLLAVSGGALVAALLFFVWSKGVARETSAAATDVDRMLIAPLEMESGGADDSLRTVTTTLLASALGGAPGVRVVDPGAVASIAPRAVTSNQGALQLSRHFGAARFLRGVVARQGTHVVVRATLHDASTPDSIVATVEAEGAADSLLSVTDRLAAELLAATYPANHRRLAQAAARSTRSLDAFKAYLAGDAAMNKKQYAVAVQAYERAVAIDSGFALAYYQLSIASDWAPSYLVTRDAADRALKASANLDERERLLVAAMRAWRFDDFDEAEALYRQLTKNWRGDVDANYQLAEVLFHSNTLRCRSFVESEQGFIQVLAADAANDEARLHLARIAAWVGDRHRADSLLQPLIASMPAAQSLELRTFRAAVMHDDAALVRLAAEFEYKDDEAIYVSCNRVAVWARNLDAAERLCRVLTSPRRSPESRAGGHLFLAELAMARGERVRARQELELVPEVGLPWSLAARAWFETMDGTVTEPGAVKEARDALIKLDAVAAEARDARFPWFARGHVNQQHYYLALLDRALGDATAASREARMITEPADAPLGQSKRGYGHSIAARFALDAGHASQAVALSTVRWPHVAGDEFSNVSTRFVRAAALEAIDRRQDALDCYASFDGSYMAELVLAAPAHLRRAAIFERQGAVAEARREYDIAFDLWQHPDAALQPIWQAARRRRAALGP